MFLLRGGVGVWSGLCEGSRGPIPGGGGAPGNGLPFSRGMQCPAPRTVGKSRVGAQTPIAHAQGRRESSTRLLWGWCCFRIVMPPRLGCIVMLNRWGCFVMRTRCKCIVRQRRGCIVLRIWRECIASCRQGADSMMHCCGAVPVSTRCCAERLGMHYDAGALGL